MYLKTFPSWDPVIIYNIPLHLCTCYSNDDILLLVSVYDVEVKVLKLSMIVPHFQSVHYKISVVIRKYFNYVKFTFFNPRTYNCIYFFLIFAVIHVISGEICTCAHAWVCVCVFGYCTSIENPTIFINSFLFSDFPLSSNPFWTAIYIFGKFTNYIKLLFQNDSAGFFFFPHFCYKTTVFNYFNRSKKKCELVNNLSLFLYFLLFILVFIFL